MVQETETQTTMLLTASENENNIPKTTNNAPTDYGESNANYDIKAGCKNREMAIILNILPLQS